MDANWGLPHDDLYSQWAVVTTNNVLSCSNPGEKFPVGFISIPCYALWIKYASACKPEKMPKRVQDHKFHVAWYIRTAAEGIDVEPLPFRPLPFETNSFLPMQKYPNMSWVNTPFPDEIFKKADPVLNADDNIYGSYQMLIKHQVIDQEMEDKYDLLAMRCYVYMNIKLWDPVKIEVMMDAAKKLREKTRRPLFKMFNCSDLTWNRESQPEVVREDPQTFSTELFQRSAKAIMAGHILAVNEVIFYNILPHIPYTVTNFIGLIPNLQHYLSTECNISIAKYNTEKADIDSSTFENYRRRKQEAMQKEPVVRNRNRRGTNAKPRGEN